MAPGDNRSSIPAWQRATSLPGAEDVKADAPATEAQTQPEDAPDSASSSTSAPTHERARNETSTVKDDIDSLRDSAFKWLNDPLIKNATRERKVAFLESKGLKTAEIELLLSLQPAAQQLAPPPQSAQTTPSAPSQPPNDAPPIISYPEFLVQPEKPPPLVTKTLLLNTAYTVAGLYGTLYALSKYIINPMQAQLSEARHELLIHSTNQMEAFNSKLGGLVSSQPGSTSRPGTALRHHDDRDDESDTSDPTELFHRDFGTQTSPSLSRRNSSSSADENSKPTDPIQSAANTLTTLQTLLNDLKTQTEKETEQDETSKQLSELVTTLNEMAYTSSSYYKYGSGINGGYSWGGDTKAQDDEIERLVKEVKGLKGRFLGVRNFARVGATR